MCFWFDIVPWSSRFGLIFEPAIGRNVFSFFLFFFCLYWMSCWIAWGIHLLNRREHELSLLPIYLPVIAALDDGKSDAEVKFIECYGFLLKFTDSLEAGMSTGMTSQIPGLLCLLVLWKMSIRAENEVALKILARLKQFGHRVGLLCGLFKVWGLHFEMEHRQNCFLYVEMSLINHWRVSSHKNDIFLSVYSDSKWFKTFMNFFCWAQNKTFELYGGKNRHGHP